jgi:hypothetical protein
MQDVFCYINEMFCRERQLWKTTVTNSALPKQNFKTLFEKISQNVSLHSPTILSGDFNQDSSQSSSVDNYLKINFQIVHFCNDQLQEAALETTELWSVHAYIAIPCLLISLSAKNTENPGISYLESGRKTLVCIV